MSRQAIDRGHEQFVAAMRAGDASALAVLLAEDVQFDPPHEASRKGKQNVTSWAQELFAAVKTQRVSTSGREVVLNGDYAIERGEVVWAVTPAAGGATSEERGRFLAIWQRQSDGSWKVKHDIWNSINPVAGV